VVLVEGQSPCGIFILCQGRAKLSTTSQLVGTSRETITRLLSEFRRTETAELKGSTLIIHSQPALKNMVQA
jgi:CRP-like cAMP-binding protein